MKVIIFVVMFVIMGSMSFGKVKAQSPAIEKLYQSKCSTCHGAKGEGSAKFAKMMKVEESKLMLNSVATVKTADDMLLKALLQGRGRMPAFQGKITPDEAKQLIQYIKKFKK